MPNQTSLGFEAICDTFVCNHLDLNGGDVIAGDITCDTIQVTGLTTMNGIINTGTITTDDFIATNTSSDYINNVVNTIPVAVFPGQIIVADNFMTSTFKNYSCVLTLNGISRQGLTTNPFDYVMGLFVELIDSTGNILNQFETIFSFLRSTKPPLNQGSFYYPCALCWPMAGIYSNSEQLAITFNICNTTSGNALITSSNQSLSSRPQDGDHAIDSEGILINNAWSFGTGSAPPPPPGVPTPGTPHEGPFRGIRLLFTDYWSTAGTASLSVNGYN